MTRGLVVTLIVLLAAYFFVSGTYAKHLWLLFGVLAAVPNVVRSTTVSGRPLTPGGADAPQLRRASTTRGFGEQPGPRVTILRRAVWRSRKRPSMPSRISGRRSAAPAKRKRPETTRAARVPDPAAQPPQRSSVTLFARLSARREPPSKTYPPEGSGPRRLLLVGRGVERLGAVADAARNLASGVCSEAQLIAASTATMIAGRTRAW